MINSLEDDLYKDIKTSHSVVCFPATSLTYLCVIKAHNFIYRYKLGHVNVVGSNLFYQRITFPFDFKRWNDNEKKSIIHLPQPVFVPWSFLVKCMSFFYFSMSQFNQYKSVVHIPTTTRPNLPVILAYILQPGSFVNSLYWFLFYLSLACQPHQFISLQQNFIVPLPLPDSIRAD